MLKNKDQHRPLHIKDQNYLREGAKSFNIWRRREVRWKMKRSNSSLVGVIYIISLLILMLLLSKPAASISYSMDEKTHEKVCMDRNRNTHMWTNYIYISYIYFSYSHTEKQYIWNLIDLTSNRCSDTDTLRFQCYCCTSLVSLIHRTLVKWQVFSDLLSCTMRFKSET